MSDSDSSEAPTPAKKIRRSFTAAKKLEIVAYAKSVSLHAAEKKYRITRSTIRPWIKDEIQLKSLW
jgi:transposase-like protein